MDATGPGGAHFVFLRGTHEMLIGSDRETEWAHSVSRRRQIKEKWSRSVLSAHHRPLSRSSGLIFFSFLIYLHRIHRGWPEDKQVRRKGSGAASTAPVTSVICICVML